MQDSYRQHPQMITRIPKKRNKPSPVKRIFKFLIAGIVLLFTGCLVWHLFPCFIPFDLQVPHLEETLQTRSFALRKELKQIHGEQGFLPDFLPSEDPALQTEMKRLAALTAQYLKDDLYLQRSNHPPAESQNIDRKERYPERVWEFSYFLEKILADKKILPPDREWQDGQVLCRIANFSAEEYRTAVSLGIELDARDALILLRSCAVAGLRQAIPEILPVMIFQQTLQAMAEDVTYSAEILEQLSAQLDLFRQEQFPQKRFIMAHRLKTIQDFERLRLNGISLFLGERLPEQQIKDAVRDIRIGNLFSGISAAVRDWRYQEDKDELIALQMYRFLLVPDFVPISQYPAVLMSKIPRQCILARIVHQDLKNTIDDLTRIYAELENFSIALDLLKKNNGRDSQNNSGKTEQKISQLNRFSGTEVLFEQTADGIQWSSGMIRISPEKEENL